MDIVKKNWLSIACGVVALLALAALPFYVGAQQKDLQKKLDARQKTHVEITGVLKKPRHLPVVSIDPNATAPELGPFPSPTVIKAGQEAITKVQKQSEELEKLATDMNRHKVLLEGSLPVPQDIFSFQQAYSKEMHSGIPERLNSATPPTDAEIKEKMAAEEKRLTDLAPKNQATGQVFNPDLLASDIAKMRETLPDNMRIQAATQHKIYLDANALSLDPEINQANGVNQIVSPERVWLAQLGLWVQQDVVDAVGDLNKDSKAVADAIVKQLIKIEVPSDHQIYAMPGTTGPATPAPPSAVGQPAASPVKANTVTDLIDRDYSSSPTGRVCNGVFDVVHFTVCMNVQASDVNKVIRGLEKNRLLTVYQSDVEGVNSAALQQEGYFFGPNPVVTLTVKCEELFLRSWTRPLMPPPIKQLLNVQEPQPTAMAN